jgi:WD40 repeat protein
MDPNTQHYGPPWQVQDILPHVPIRQFEFEPFNASRTLVAAGNAQGTSMLIELFENGADKHEEDGSGSHAEGANPWSAYLSTSDIPSPPIPSRNHVSTPHARILGAVRYCSTARSDSVLAISWLKTRPYAYIAGSSSGQMRLIDCSFVDAAMDTDESDRPVGCIPEMPILYSYSKLPDLTCVHVNCDDSYLLASGYTYHVPVYDMSTGLVVRTFENAHTGHINITRFASTNRNIFASSSFDKTVKVWDMRSRETTRPIYCVSSTRGNVTISFSPDDQYLLTCAVDNELRQYVTADGSLFCRMDMQETGRSANYTRGYYADGGATIVSGSSEESVVRMHSASTGELLHTADLQDSRPPHRLYTQSLRGHPNKRGFVGVLCSHWGPDYQHRLLTVNFFQRNERFNGDKKATKGTELEAALDVVDAPFSSMVGPLSSARSLKPSASYFCDLWEIFASCQRDGAAARIDAYASILSCRGEANGCIKWTVTPTSGSEAPLRPVLGYSGANVSLVCGSYRISAIAGVLIARLPFFRDVLGMRDIPMPALIIFDSPHIDFACLATALIYSVTDSFVPCVGPWLDQSPVAQNEYFPPSEETTALIHVEHMRATHEAAHQVLCASWAEPLGGRDSCGPFNVSAVSGCSDPVLRCWDAIGSIRDIYEEHVLSPGVNAEHYTEATSKRFLVNCAIAGVHGACQPSLQPEASETLPFGARFIQLQSDVHADATASRSPARNWDGVSRLALLLRTADAAFNAAAVFGVDRLAFLAVWRFSPGPNNYPELSKPTAFSILRFAHARCGPALDERLGQATASMMEKHAANPLFLLRSTLMGNTPIDSVSRAVVEMVCSCMLFIAQHLHELRGTLAWDHLTADMPIVSQFIVALHTASLRRLWRDESRNPVMGRLPPLPNEEFPGVPAWSNTMIRHARDTRPPEFIEPLARRVSYFWTHPEVDPVHDMFAYPTFLPRTHENGLIYASNPSGSSRVCVVGGHGKTNELSSRIMYSYEMHATSAEPSAPAGTWSMSETHGDAPRNLLYHRMAPIGGGSPRFYVVTGFMDSHITASNSGPGSPSWLSPWLTASASGATPMPFTHELSEHVVTMLSASRISVLDTWANTWHVITPEWADLPQGVQALNRGEPLSAGDWNFAPPPRYGGTFTMMQPQIADPTSSAEHAPEEASFDIVIFGGISEKLGNPVEHSHPGGYVRADVYCLTVQISKRISDTTAPEWGLSFAWQKPTIVASPEVPSPRLWHGAVACPLPMSEGGNVMVVFGGQSNHRYVNDVWVLSSVETGAGDKRRSVQWHKPEVFGLAPSRRAGHTMTSLYNVDASPVHPDIALRTFVIFGGLTNGGYLNDVHIGAVAKHGPHNAYVVRYSQPRINNPPHAVTAPCPRRWHSAVYVPSFGHEPAFSAVGAPSRPGIDVPGGIFVFGGRDNGDMVQLPPMNQEQSRALEGLLNRMDTRAAREAVKDVIRSSRVSRTGSAPSGRPLAQLWWPHPAVGTPEEIDDRDMFAGVEFTDDETVNDPPAWIDENVDSNLYVLRMKSLTPTPRHVYFTHEDVSTFSAQAQYRSPSTLDLASMFGRASDLVARARQWLATPANVYRPAFEPLVQAVQSAVATLSAADITTHGTTADYRREMALIYTYCRPSLLQGHIDNGFDVAPPPMQADIVHAQADMTLAQLSRRLDLFQAALCLDVVVEWECPAAQFVGLLQQTVVPVPTSTFALDMFSTVEGSRERLLALASAGEPPKAAPVAYSDFSLDVPAVSDEGATDPACLAAFSSFLRQRAGAFRIMLQEPADGSARYEEANSGHVVAWPDTDRRTAANFLHYIMTDTLHPDLNPDDALQLLLTAERYEVPRLARCVEAMLIRVLNVDNVFGLLSFVHSYDPTQFTPSGDTPNTGSGMVVDSSVGTPVAAITKRTADSRIWATLRTACISFILRDFTRLQSHEDYLALDEELITEVTNTWKSGKHVYALEALEANPAAQNESSAA